MTKQSYIELLEKFESVLKKDIIHFQEQKTTILELVTSKNASDINFMLHSIFILIEESENRTNKILQNLQTELTVQKL